MTAEKKQSYCSPFLILFFFVGVFEGMIVNNDVFVSVEVLCITLTFLITLTLFLCCLVRNKFVFHDQNAMIAWGLSLLGTVTLFLVLSETNPQTVCVVSSLISSPSSHSHMIARPPSTDIPTFDI